MATFLPLGFLSGYASSWVMKKLNILRVPAEVELRASTWPSTTRTCTCRRWRWQPSEIWSPTELRWQPR